MTRPENGISSGLGPKKQFFRVPEGIQDFTDEQIDAWAENFYNQIVFDSGSSQTEGQNQELTEDKGE